MTVQWHSPHGQNLVNDLHFLLLYHEKLSEIKVLIHISTYNFGTSIIIWCFEASKICFFGLKPLAPFGACKPFMQKNCKKQFQWHKTQLETWVNANYL